MEIREVFQGRSLRLGKIAALIIDDSVQNYFFTSAFHYHKNDDGTAKRESSLYMPETEQAFSPTKKPKIDYEA